MDLYASPMACSLAAHIAALEAGVPVTLRYLDLKSKRTDEGDDYRTISPTVTSRRCACRTAPCSTRARRSLQWLADQSPASGLAPAWGTVDRYRLIGALNFLSTEVHKKVFAPLVGANATDESRAATRGLVAPTLDRIAARLGERDDARRRHLHGGGRLPGHGAALGRACRGQAGGLAQPRRVSPSATCSARR